MGNHRFIHWSNIGYKFHTASKADIEWTALCAFVVQKKLMHLWAMSFSTLCQMHFVAIGVLFFYM